MQMEEKEAHNIEQHTKVPMVKLIRGDMIDG